MRRLVCALPVELTFPPSWERWEYYHWLKDKNISVQNFLESCWTVLSTVHICCPKWILKFQGWPLDLLLSFVWRHLVLTRSEPSFNLLIRAPIYCACKSANGLRMNTFSQLFRSSVMIFFVHSLDCTLERIFCICIIFFSGCELSYFVEYVFILPYNWEYFCWVIKL